MRLAQRCSNSATHMSKIGESAFEEFQTFCQNLNGPAVVLEGMVPNRSIFKSPFMSIGIGCESEEAGADTDFVSVPYLRCACPNFMTV